MQYVFILGHNPLLSAAEIKAVLPEARPVLETGSFLILESVEIDCRSLMSQLGGTIKIGQVIKSKQDQTDSAKAPSGREDKDIIVEELMKIKTETKLNFGISFYSGKISKLGMEVKGELKRSGISCRLVTGREPILSSVIVTKNKCHEFMVLGQGFLAKTCAVQEFEEYSLRDYGRPGRDLVSGMMPPKLAKIMINLAQTDNDKIILDPFCGSGTIIQEAILLGYKKIIGSDFSEKAINDTKQNLNWLEQKGYQLSATGYRLIKADVRVISKHVDKVDAIISEPYLGPALRGRESISEIKKNITELSELYLSAFLEFKKILPVAGRVVIIIPSFRLGNDTLFLPILEQIRNLGFKQLNERPLVYSRPSQLVLRQIYVFKNL